MPANTIDEVIARLEGIISECIEREDPLGFFAVLYHKVTVKVKEGIANGDFENGPRMERLDVAFANRYLEAYDAYQHQQPVTDSWQRAFALQSNYWPIVLQHLLMGINAHINLDLGIASAEISEGDNIDDLKHDFDKINDILSSLVNDVQEDLARIWPTLLKILKWSKKTDDFLVDFSMVLARNGAWKFAKSLAGKSPEELPGLIKIRDGKVAANTRFIIIKGMIPTIVFGIIRIGERGSVGQKIAALKD